MSKSGNLSIEADDWMFERGYSLKPIPLHTPAEVHWSVQFICGGKPETIDEGNGTNQYRYVIGSGCLNGKHTAKLSFPPNDLASAVEFRAYKPPLQAN